MVHDATLVGFSFNVTLQRTWERKNLSETTQTT